MPKYRFFENWPGRIDDPAAPYAVMPVPYERSTSFLKGTARAPGAILKASEQIELFDEELLDRVEPGVLTLPEPRCRAGTEQEALDSIRLSATEALARGKRFLMALGGEHSITAPLVGACNAAHGGISVLHLDAHLDLRDTYNDSRLSHACVMRRVAELNVPVTHVGIRSLCEEEYDLVRAGDVMLFWARAIAESTDDSWMDAVVQTLGSRVYVTIDCDCFDPSVIPGTGTPEPGGLSWRQATGLLRRVCSARKVVSADIVELVPVPGCVASEYAAARLAAKIINYHAVSERDKSGKA